MAFNGKNIELWREENKLSQRECAELLGITQAYLSEIEANKKVPSVLLLEAISNKTGKSIQHFFISNPTVTPAGSEALQGEKTA